MVSLVLDFKEITFFIMIPVLGEKRKEEYPLIQENS